MVKCFTTNKNNKIELTLEELEALLRESYNEGYNKGKVEYIPTYAPYTPNTPLTAPKIWDLTTTYFK